MNMKQNRESAEGDKDIMTDGDDTDTNTMADGGDTDTNTMTDGGNPQPFNADDGDDELSGIDTTFKLDMGSPHDQLSQYNRCACADGTEVLVLK